MWKTCLGGPNTRSRTKPYRVGSPRLWIPVSGSLHGYRFACLGLCVRRCVVLPVGVHMGESPKPSKSHLVLYKRNIMLLYVISDLPRFPVCFVWDLVLGTFCFACSGCAAELLSCKQNPRIEGMQRQIRGIDVEEHNLGVCL